MGTAAADAILLKVNRDQLHYFVGRKRDNMNASYKFSMYISTCSQTKLHTLPNISCIQVNVQQTVREPTSHWQ